MRKIIIICGMVLCAILVEGVVFFLSSRVPAEVESAEANAAPVITDFSELIDAADEAAEFRQIAVAQGYLQLALDLAKSENERAIAGSKMGHLFFEDYKRGGESRVEAAALYLQAAYDCAEGEGHQIDIGLVLLDVFQEIGDEGTFMSYLDELLALHLSPDQRARLWKQKFTFLLGPYGDWSQMNDALGRAEMLPLQSAEWAVLLKDVRLRSREKLLVDPDWFLASSQAIGTTTSEDYRRDVFEEIKSALMRIINDGNRLEREEAYLRLATACVAIDAYEEGNEYLARYLEMGPSEHLTEALMLLSRISRVQGDVADAAQLAESLIRRFDFNNHTREEVLLVTRLLEEHELYADALELLNGCFSLTDELGKEYSALLVHAALLEERLGHRDNMLDCMSRLAGMDAYQEFGEAFSQLIELNLGRGDYESVEKLIHRFYEQLSAHSDANKDALFTLFEAKYWLDRPVLEQLFIGFAAVQMAPEDLRTPSVELRMARYIEELNLNDLAISYYNRIGLLNFFQGDSVNTSSQSIGDQAMLGKARCLKKMEQWVEADHLYRDLCKRTQSPLVKSEAAVGWAELALRFGQKREAMRRFDLAYFQMLPNMAQVRYTVGRSKAEGEDGYFGNPEALESNLELLENLSDEERRAASVSFFNDTFDSLYKAGDARGMERVIDLAYQSDFTEWLPILSYALRLHEESFQRDGMVGLGDVLRQKNEVAGAAMVELARVVDRVGELSDLVERHKKKKAANE